MTVKAPGIGTQVTWTTLPGKPSVFAPAAHTHPWIDITGKPTTFAPSAHTHLWADITDRPTIPAVTPLATATPQPLGTAAVGTSTNAAREDHVHAKPVGLLTLLGTATVGETMTVGVALGVRRYTQTITGAAVGDRLVIALTGAPSNGTIQDAYVSAANTANIGLLVPALSIGAVVAVPLAVYKVS